MNNEIENKKIDLNTTLEQDIEYQEELEKNNETKNIDINDLFKSIINSYFIYIEILGNDIKDSKSNTISENIKWIGSVLNDNSQSKQIKNGLKSGKSKWFFIVVLVLLIWIILFCGIWWYTNKKQRTNNHKIINSLIDNNWNIDNWAIYQLKNLKWIDDETKTIVNELGECPSILEERNNSDLKITLDISEFKDINKINGVLSGLESVQKTYRCLNLITKLYFKFEDYDWDYSIVSRKAKFSSTAGMVTLLTDSCKKLYLYLLTIQDYIYYDEEWKLIVTDDSIYDELIRLSDIEQNSLRGIQSILEKM